MQQACIWRRRGMLIMSPVDISDRFCQRVGIGIVERRNCYA
jgi:hypothetical protein